jgi:hypothetical protein
MKKSKNGHHSSRRADGRRMSHYSRHKTRASKKDVKIKLPYGNDYYARGKKFEYV